MGRALEHGILDPPRNAEKFVGKLAAVPQDERDLKIGRKALKDGLATGSQLWEDINKEETMIKVAGS